MAKIGLVAGYGTLPVTFARNAKAKGDTVIGLGIKGLTDEDLAKYVEKMHWFEWGNLQKAMLVVAVEGIRQIVLLGKIKKELAFDNKARLDADAKKILSAAGGKKDYTILREVEKLLKKVGINIIDPTPYLEELIPKTGTLTRRAPGEKEWDDINYGKEVAKAMAGSDIGQALAVKDKTVIAVEAAEGTDEMIKRAGDLVGGGFAVVKMARPDQDMRFDVPAAGVDTIKSLIAAKGTVLALEAGKTFLSEKDGAIRLADDNSISIVAI